MNVSQIVKDVGQVASAFNPVVGQGIFLVGSILNSFDGVEDKVLEDNFLGFSKSVEILRNISQKDELDEISKEQLKMVADNLDDINKLIDKLTKIIK